MTWQEAKEIRKGYPRRLTNKHIQEILRKWGVLDDLFRTDRPDMFHFACTPRKDGKMNISELKLWFMFNNEHHKLELKEYNQNNNQLVDEIHGCVIAAWFGHIIDGGEYEPSTQNLRKRTLRHLLKIWWNYSINFYKQIKGVQTVLDIKTKVRSDMIERYPDSKKHFDSKSFENQCWEIIKTFVYENR